jgi:hypothetical protein
LALGLVLLAGSAAAARGRSPAIARAPSFVAEEAEPDSGLGGYLEGLSDSTDHYFGLAAVSPDTAGNDSALAYGLLHPNALEGGAFPLHYGLSFAFNRAEGPVYGGSLGFGRPILYGSLNGKLAYAVGSDDLLGGAEYLKRVHREHGNWTLRAFGGRIMSVMDGDHPDVGLATARALIDGRDGQHYFREDGFEARLEREAETWRVAVGYRDMLQSALPTTTTWNLTNRPISVAENVAAAFGRAHELGVSAGAQLPGLPVTAQLDYRTAGEAIGSDLEYRRMRVALSGDWGLGRLASVVPQAAYGRLNESVVPQAAFYLGGDHSLRSLPTAALGGTGMAVARLDVIGTFDILAAAHIPHPVMFPLQLGVFGATGAAWGQDPYGGPTVPGVDWPERQSWRSEAGASLIYQPGFPDPTMLLRFNFAQGIGPDGESRWSFSYSRALDLVRTFSR